MECLFRLLIFPGRWRFNTMDPSVTMETVSSMETTNSDATPAERIDVKAQASEYLTHKIGESPTGVPTVPM